MKSYKIGIDVGGTKVAYGLFDSDSNLVARRRHPSSGSMCGGEFCDIIIENVRAIISENDIDVQELEGVGICMPSYVLFNEGAICMTTALPLLNNFPLRDYMRERLSLNVVLDNDANCAALCEHRFGAGKGHEHMLYITLSTGLGSGIILNNRVFRGSNGFAGECGHMLITPDEGIECGCENKGCFMSWGSGLFIPRQVKALAEKTGMETNMNLDTLDNLTFEKACKEGDPLALVALEQTARYIGICIFNVYQMLNVDTFVFGGGLVNFGDMLLNRIYDTFNRYNHTGQKVHFLLAEHSKDFGIIGAAELL